VKTTISDLVIWNDNFGVFTSRETISICKDIRLQNCIRLTRPRLVDPYTLQYVFSFDHITDFSSYPNPTGQFQDILWKDKQYLFHLHILGMDYVENDNAFLPQMDLNNNFLRVESCVNVYFDNQAKILIPSLIAGGAVLFIIIISIFVCICKSKRCGCCNKKVKGEKKMKILQNKLMSESQVPIRSNSASEESSIKSSKKKLKKNIQQGNFNSPSNLLTYDSINDNKMHSTGIYITGNNHHTAPFNYTDSDVSNSTDSYLNPKYSNKLSSRPSSAQMNNYRLSDSLPLSIDSKKIYFSDESLGFSNNQNNQKQQQQQYEPKNQKFVSSCHIPIYGSTANNGRNFINIKKAIDNSNSRNPGYPVFNYNFLNEDDEDDSYNMMPM
jgi:hypothetical protein